MKQYITGYIYADALALGTTASGPAFECAQIFAPYIQITVSGATALNTSLSVQGTNDISKTTGQPQNWVTLSEFTAKNITANGTSYWFLPKDMLSMNFIRITNTNSAGTGSAKITISGVRP